MKNNLFTKTMLRQPVKVALLCLLLLVAAFSFVMRSVEYIVITEKVNEISGYYRAIGTLNYTGESWVVDVRPGAEVVSASPYVDFDDRRRTVEAVLLDMPNVATQGHLTRLLSRPSAVPNDAFFYGALTQVQSGYDGPYIALTIEVDKVLLGYPEHVKAGQTVTLHYFMDETEKSTGNTPVTSMSVGQRYLLRGAYFIRWDALESDIPMAYMNQFVMMPLSERTFDAWERNPDRDGVWFLPANPGEELDAAIPGLEGLHQELNWIQYALGTVRLQTTMDMSSMPIMQNQEVRGRLVAGRWIDREDNEESRPVIAVHESFARRRGLEIGDTLAIGIPPGQRITGGASIAADRYLDVYVMGAAFAPFSHILELEIVGLFQFVNAADTLSDSQAASFVYIPDSVLPPDVTLEKYETRSMIGGEIVDITFEEGFISNVWYSFVLNDPRDVDNFLLENRDALQALGFSVGFMPGIAGARAFWDFVEPILQSVVFNMVLFSVAAFMILLLVSYLYVRQRQKDFAISRALGNPARKAYRQLFTTFIIFAMPAIIVGSIGGWFFALSEAANALEPLGNRANDLVDGYNLSALWMLALVGAEFAMLIIISLSCGLVMSRRPILEMLQGSTANRARVINTAKTPDQPASTLGATRRSGNPDNQIIQEAASNKIYSANIQFICRHILRQRTKTLLVATIAIFFVLALGFLQEVIENTRQEIDCLYDTTIVTGEIMQTNPLETSIYRYVGNTIGAWTIYNVGAITKNEYIDAGHEYSAIIPANADGTLPENWDEVIGICRDGFISDIFHAFSPILGISDVDSFLAIHSEDATDSLPGVTGETDGDTVGDSIPFEGLCIEFAQGYDPSEFISAADGTVPLIISDRIMRERGIEMWDTVYIAIAATGSRRGWEHIPAVVVGVHNRNIRMKGFVGAAIMPLASIEHILGEELGYITFRFEIDPALNREIPLVRQELTSIIRDKNAGWLPLRLVLHDAELRMVVGPMEQNLSLLGLLYPVAIVFSVIVGLGLSILLTLQNAKIAAIMRSLGVPRKGSRIVLCMEQVAVCLAGLALGLLILAISGMGFGIASSLGLAGMYFAGSLAGAASGAIVVTNRPPLELLQVRE